jgi:hypothetical protein
MPIANSASPRRSPRRRARCSTANAAEPATARIHTGWLRLIGTSVCGGIDAISRPRPNRS